LHGVFAKSPPEVFCCESGTPGYSFYFDLIAPIWRNCRAEGAIHRLCSLMRKMGAKTLLREELEPNDEILQEFDDLQTRVDKKFPSELRAIRFSFFAAPCRDKDKWQDQLPATSFLGYAVVLRVELPTDAPVVKERCPSGEMAYVLEAVTRPPAWVSKNDNGGYAVAGVTNYYVHCHREFKTTVGPRGASKEYTLHGAFFCQQNGLTHVCAHAALRMILNTSDGLVENNRKITNRELNNILAIDHRDAVVSGGLLPAQILAIPNRLRINILGGDFVADPTVDYAEWAYPLVESGYPVLLAFNPTHLAGHVVTVLGHTMNSDKWDCEAHLAYRPEAFGTYHASAAWVDHFIINDDNFGMYTCMPPSYLRSKVLPQYDRTQRATFAIGFLPPGLDVSPYIAEKDAVGLVRKLRDVCQPASANRWLRRIWEQLQQLQKGIVARTLGCTREQYIAHLTATVDSDGNGPVSTIPKALANAPDHLWLTEISLPDLYTANKHKLGDILLDAKAAERDGQPIETYVWGWLPGLQIPCNASPVAWPLTGHVPVFRQSKVLGPHREW